jgi:retron-type reverse transcriptase
MRRYGNLWQRLISFPNLLAAARKAQRGKRLRPNVLAFHFALERELWMLHEELAAQTYRPGPYRTFTLPETKPRLISAAPYRDRVVHHTLCNVLEPLFEPSFLPDSYACRPGKGTHAAMRRSQHYARRFRWVLKADVRKFFPSLDHAVLKDLLACKVKDPFVLGLAGLLIDHSNPQEEVQNWFPGDDLFGPAQRRRGLPIGNQTSQFFANVYLDPLDHFVKDRLAVGGYVRYVDDFLLFGDDPRTLASLRGRVVEFLSVLRLRLHPDKCMVFPCRQGIRFVGYRVWPTHVKLVKDNVWRFRRRLRRLRDRYRRNELSAENFVCRVASWIGHARQADSIRLLERLLGEHFFSGAAAG